MADAHLITSPCLSSLQNIFRSAEPEEEQRRLDAGVWGFQIISPPPLSIVLSKMTRMNWEFFDKHQGQTSVSLKALLNCDRAVGAQLR